MQDIIGSVHDLNWSEKAQRKFFRHEVGSNLAEKLTEYTELEQNMGNLTENFKTLFLTYGEDLKNEKKSTNVEIHQLKIPKTSNQRAS